MTVHIKHILVILALSTALISFAQPPAIQPTPLADVPQLEPLQPQPQATDGVQNQIRDALQGDSPVGSADPVLDDVLQIIQQRGSILDGSSLDELERPAKSTHLKSDRSPAFKRARAAESLLKAARHLEQIGPLDDAQGKLIQQMRQQSARLLTTPPQLTPAD